MDERQHLDADIVCVGFGPATAGFLATLSRLLAGADGTTPPGSRVMEGMPLQVLCFERADDLAAGVSGVVTRARGIRASFPDVGPEDIPLCAPVREESLVYLLDPVGASRRSRPMRALDAVLRRAPRVAGVAHDAVRLPFIPRFLRKEEGWILSIGQFTQWVASHVLGTGTVQIWPGSPVATPLFDGTRVVGVRLADQGVDGSGTPREGYLPGMDVRAGLTVVGDGPVGAIGRSIDERVGVPEGCRRDDWALGMKMVVELREDAGLEPGTVVHTFGYPEPEIFGFLYVTAPRQVSFGIFVPSWFGSPVRTAYRYLQHWMLHPYLWRWLEGGTLRSWGAKTLLEAGRRGQPHLAGDGYARIGEGSGSTNVLSGSGVDEAWTTGVLLAEAVAELLGSGEHFTRESLERTYVRRRRESWVAREGGVAEHARDGFHAGVLRGLLGMAATGLTGGRLRVPARTLPPHAHVRAPEDFYRDRLTPGTVAALRASCEQRGVPLHDAIMEAAGWPPVPYDGRLLVTHQDALLLGGKVQAAPGYADHVVVRDPAVCRTCAARLCVEACSGEALAPGAEGAPRFDRDKCIHCGACLWNCTHPADALGRTNIDFRAGAGGLHSTEN